MTPVILLHGIFGYDRVKLGPVTISYFGRIARNIAQAGHPVLTPAAHPTASVRHRAQQIKQAVLPWLKEQKTERAIIIAHSMGGLDARYLVSQLGLGPRISAVVTIGTPHRGSALADFWMDMPPVKRMALPILKYLGLDTTGGADVTLAGMRRFNEEVPDCPDVSYYSVSLSCPPDRVPLYLRLGYEVVRRFEGDNDGIVSVASAIWGEHLGTWPIHHLHAINRRFPIDRACEIRDVTPKYLAILQHLREAGVMV